MWEGDTRGECSIWAVRYGWGKSVTDMGSPLRIWAVVTDGESPLRVPVKGSPLQMRIARYELDNGCRYLARLCSAPRGLTRHARGMHAALTAVLAHARHSAALASEGRPAWMAEQYGDNVRTPD